MAVQNSSRVDKERLENIKESLKSFFNITPSMMEATVPNVSLSNLFNSESQEDDAPMPGSHSTGIKYLTSIFYCFSLCGLPNLKKNAVQTKG